MSVLAELEREIRVREENMNIRMKLKLPDREQGLA